MKSLWFHLALMLMLGSSSAVLSRAASTEVANRTDSAVSAMQAKATTPSQHTAQSTTSPNWQGPAKLHRTLGGTSGTLLIDTARVQFRPTKGEARLWPITEIETLDL